MPLAYERAEAGAGGGEEEQEERLGNAEFMRMTSSQKTELRFKLAARAGIALPARQAVPVPVPAPSPPSMVASGAAPLGSDGGGSGSGGGGGGGIAGAPSTCLVLQNVFDLAEEAATGADWDVELKGEVVGEVSAKHGAVRHSYVESARPGGLVYLMMGTVDAAASVAAAMHGRFFGGHELGVRFVPPPEYEAKFPEAKNAMPAD